MKVDADWLVPNWPAPSHVKAVCTTRQGGVSKVPYHSLNLGSHVGDALADVAKNRALLQGCLGESPRYLEQVHGKQVAHWTATNAGFEMADACWTQDRGAVCTMLVADCLPVLFTDSAGSFVAAAHAGWRGLASGVLEALLQTVAANMEHSAGPAKNRLDAQPRSASDILAWLGPCIGPAEFEVGDEVRNIFLAHDANAAALFCPGSHAGTGRAVPGKWLANLQGLARQRLAAFGVDQIYGNDGGPQWCTVSNPSKFFSHRRDSVTLGGSGRMAACIWLG